MKRSRSRAVAFFSVLLPIVARWVIGGFFIYMGLNKALHPVEFLKLVRQYDLLQHHLLLNAIAVLLPWFEVFCGLLLVLGIAVRGNALLLLGMLVPFTWVVIHRAWDLHVLRAVPFCAVKFDCGCGMGEVFICRKIVENSLLMLLSFWLTLKSSGRLCARFKLAR